MTVVYDAATVIEAIRDGDAVVIIRDGKGNAYVRLCDPSRDSTHAIASVDMIPGQRVTIEYRRDSVIVTEHQ